MPRSPIGLAGGTHKLSPSDAIRNPSWAPLLARHFADTVDRTRLLNALGHFRRAVGQLVLLVWDRLSTHTSRRTRAWMTARAADFACAFLPGYAPALNPEEQ